MPFAASAHWAVATFTNLYSPGNFCTIVQLCDAVVLDKVHCTSGAPTSVVASWMSRHLPLARLQISYEVFGSKSPRCTRESQPSNAIVVDAMSRSARGECRYTGGGIRVGKDCPQSTI